MGSYNHSIEFKESSIEALPEEWKNNLKFPLVRVQSVVLDGTIVAYIGYENNKTPHVEYLTAVSARNVLEMTIAFCNRMEQDFLIRCFANTKNLFDRVCKRSSLTFIGTDADMDGNCQIYCYQKQ